MKKVLFFTMLLLGTATHFEAQTTIFEETFESAAEPVLPAGWITIDRDGDGDDWVSNNEPSMTDPLGFSGKVGATLTSTTSDNLLVSPTINLSTGNYLYSLKFLIGTATVGGIALPENHYAVYILPAADSFIGTETPVLEEDITVGDVAVEKTVALSGYAGQSIKVYFRQFNSSNSLGILLLDTIKVSQQSTLGTSETVLSSAIGMYPNPTSDYINLKSNSKITNAEIYDTAGRKMDTKLIDNKIDVRSLSPGVYTLIMKIIDKSYSQKFVKK